MIVRSYAETIGNKTGDHMKIATRKPREAEMFREGKSTLDFFVKITHSKFFSKIEP